MTVVMAQAEAARKRRYNPELAAGLRSDARERLEAAHARLKQDGPQLAMRLDGVA